MAGANTPGGTPFRDKLNINAEEQVLFDEAVPVKKQQVGTWGAVHSHTLSVCIMVHVSCRAVGWLWGPETAEKLGNTLTNT